MKVLCPAWQLFSRWLLPSQCVGGGCLSVGGGRRPGKEVGNAWFFFSTSNSFQTDTQILHKAQLFASPINVPFSRNFLSRLFTKMGFTNDGKNVIHLEKALNLHLKKKKKEMRCTAAL